MAQKVHAFEKFSEKVVAATGSPWAFILALLTIIVWGVTGPIFKYSDTWQLVINTGTTIITFLMVFIIQKSQNKDSKSIQLKLNELIAATKTASNRLIDVESLSEEELNTLRQFYTKLALETKKHLDLKHSHSIEEAIDNIEDKVEAFKKS
ncbi:low affinity iron permease family protein [Chitinophaga sp. SYP-B3965]|uniref:low affinity iron permease family protein n=1 Tax=Chitinophaga sp. SYP-B3965 TaxID=2663120 RepID=UPI0012999A05|nr:low affinity iron permease family protein [Chitinophaga sp. SYP-B3965]MRG46651.1 low affinity iron permease family protein [Chitinophaga sp. SYP-B3965]